MLRLASAAVDGVRSPVLEGGAADAEEAVVFVHGNPGFSQDWEELTERISEFSRTIAPDMPGFGRADRPREFEYTVGAYARHLTGLLAKLGVRRAHLVLHDFGGPWGLAWAMANPDALASVTLINTGIMPGYRWHYLARIWRTPVLGELFMATSSRLGFHLLLKHGNPRGLPASFIDRMYDHFDRGTKRAVLRLYRATNDFSSIADAKAESAFSWGGPTLVIWGRADPYLPVAYAHRQREFFPRANIHILEKSGHWPFVDDPEGVAAVLIPFLKEQLEPGWALSSKSR